MARLKRKADVDEFVPFSVLNKIAEWAYGVLPDQETADAALLTAVQTALVNSIDQGGAIICGTPSWPCCVPSCVPTDAMMKMQEKAGVHIFQAGFTGGIEWHGIEPPLSASIYTNPVEGEPPSVQIPTSKYGIYTQFVKGVPLPTRAAAESESFIYSTCASAALCLSCSTVLGARRDLFNQIAEHISNPRDVVAEQQERAVTAVIEAVLPTPRGARYVLTDVVVEYLGWAFYDAFFRLSQKNAVGTWVSTHGRSEDNALPAVWPVYKTPDPAPSDGAPSDKKRKVGPVDVVAEALAAAAALEKDSSGCECGHGGEGEDCL